MTTTAKTTKTPKSATAMPFEAFNMQMPAMEVPAAFREFAEKSITQARDTYAKMKTAAEDATGMVEDTYEATRENVFAFGVKALDAAKVNSDASFALARDLFGAKTLAEIIELQTAFARQQFDTLTGQAKELQDLAQKVVTESTKPVKTQVEKTMKEFKVA